MKNFPRTGIYRVRKSKIGNKCVLQELFDFPYMANGQVDASIRDRYWVDVEWCMAPGLLKVSHSYQEMYGGISDDLERESEIDFLERKRGF